MSVSSTGSSTSTSGTSQSSSQSALSTLGPDAFLNLLTTQLKNQNPLSPMDDTQSVAQLAQFSQLQAQTNLSDSFAAFQTNFGVTQSASMIGKTVTVASSSSSGSSSSTNVTGVVNGVTIANGTPSFTLKDTSGNTILDPTSGQAETFTGSQIISISG